HEAALRPQGCDPGIQIPHITDRGIFNLQRMAAQTEVISALVCYMLSTFDCADIAHSEYDVNYSQIPSHRSQLQSTCFEQQSV
ncbi:hypothetical protein ElyMa_003846700, partial [Elysia marginata]